MIRIGQGIDVHAFVNDGTENQFITLGGVQIPHTHSLLAHSDGDVVLHALCDALLGALAMGDIGQLFPDNDAQFKGIDSCVLLKEVYARVRAKGYILGNADITVICEQPKIGPHAQAMREAMASDLGIDVDAVSVKATTSEKMGFIGRGEGIAAQAVCLLVAA